jgi:hypothetical protein
MKETMVRRERIDEELIDEHCPDVFSSKKAYDISVDFAKSEMNITVKIKLETVKATPFRHVRTMKVGGEDVIIYVTPVAAGYVPPIYTTPNPPPPLPLPPVEVSKLALKFIAELWERDIEDRWNKFQLRRFLGGRPLDIKFDVEFVDSGDYHHLVKVHPGNGRSDQSNWFFYDITGTAIDYPDYAPHEFGHMLGLDDEYKDSRCPRRPRYRDISIMDDNTSVPKPRHYKQFADWLEMSTDTKWVVEKKK